MMSAQRRPGSLARAWMAPDRDDGVVEAPTRHHNLPAR